GVGDPVQRGGRRPGRDRRGRRARPEPVDRRLAVLRQRAPRAHRKAQGHALRNHPVGSEGDVRACASVSSFQPFARIRGGPTCVGRSREDARMARRYEHAHEESRRGRTTRGAAVLAGGALVFASLVAATSPAAAGDATPVPALTAPASDEATVSGLVVKHSSPAGASAATRVAAGARITASEAGTSTITFATPTSAEEAERLAHQIEQLPGVTEVSLNAVLHPAAAPPGGAPGDPYFSELT